jgi:hypothetical protein
LPFFLIAQKKIPKASILADFSLAKLLVMTIFSCHLFQLPQIFPLPNFQSRPFFYCHRFFYCQTFNHDLFQLPPFSIATNFCQTFGHDLFFMANFFIATISIINKKKLIIKFSTTT